MNFCMANNCEYWSKSVDAYKVSVQIASLEQVLVIWMIGICMWTIDGQLITSIVMAHGVEE